MSDYMLPAVSRDGMTFEAEHALRDAFAHMQEYGTLIKFYQMGEDEVTRSDYNSIKSSAISPYIEMYANVDYNPSKETLEKVGLSEETTIMIHTPMLSWMNESMTFERIDMIRWTIEIAGEEFMISDKKRFDQIGDTYLYIVFSGKEE